MPTFTTDDQLLILRCKTALAEKSEITVVYETAETAGEAPPQLTGSS